MDDSLAQKITASMTESVIVVGCDEQIRWTNPAFALLFDYPSDQAIGMPIATLLAEEDLLSVIGFNEVFRDNLSCDINVVFCTRAGEILPTNVSGRRLDEETWLLVIRDEREMQRLLTEASKSAASERQKADELESAHQKLRIEIEARERVEVTLRHAQKLEAVGQLAAGISHEINTPVQYVSDSIYFLKESFNNLVGLVENYRRALADQFEAVSPELAARIQSAEAAADLEFILEELPEALTQSLEGLAEIARIVGAMKEFAHPDAEKKSEADLNRAIENALVVSRSEYKQVADVELDLGELPPVKCHIGHLGQVFINIIVNAAHAIGDAGSELGRGKICISTRCEEGLARIRISDTGCGIPLEVRDRIFDPFFTTKPVGKGSGQGLAIAHAIVVGKHSGEIVVETDARTGTTFIISIPIDGADEAGSMLSAAAAG